MKTLAELDYDELQVRAAEAARLPALDGDDADDYEYDDELDETDDEDLAEDEDYEGEAETRSGFGAIAVTTDPWLRERANMYLAGLPDPPQPLDALRKLDDETLEFVLLTAVYEISLEQRHLRAFDPGKHKRWPKGHPKAGKFRPMVDLLKMAILEYDPKKDKHPFENFTRPQLMNAAKARGVKLKRGEDRDSIADKLLADFAIGKAKVPAKKAAPAKAPKLPAGVKLERIQPVFGDAPDAFRVHFNGEHLGAIHGDEADPNIGWTPHVPGNAGWKLKNPGVKQSKEAAVKELVDSFKAAPPAKPKAPARPRKRAEFKLDEADRLRIKVLPFVGGPWIGKKESHQIRVGNKQIGAVHQEQNGAWTAIPVGDGEPFFKAPPKKANRDQAIKALLDAHDAAAAKKANPLVPKAAPNRKDEVNAKIAQDRLEDLDYLDLKDLAQEYGVEFIGRPKEDIISDLRREIAAGKVAAAKVADAKKAAQNAGPDLDRMNLFELVKLANQHGIEHAGLTRRELAAQLLDRMQPHGPAKYHRSLAGVEDLGNLVENGAVVKEKPLAGGAIGDTRLRTYGDGTKVVWKRSGKIGENDSEQLSSKVARAFGLHAPRIYRNRDHEVNMDFVEGDVAGDVVPGFGGFGWMAGDTERVASTNEGRMMGLLDQLIANTDRHNGNWMIRSDSRLVPIDHGYAFGNRPGQKLKDGGKPAWVRSAFAEHYSKPVLGKMEWQDNDLSKGDIAELRKRIEALKPDFEHLGRANWHQFMMERLDAIGQHATGTRSRLLPTLV